jgi:chloramphenicol O-acetyltransferase type A
MKEIVFDDEHPHRKSHFEFFNAMSHPHFNITANVDITNLLSYLKKEGLSTSVSIVYLLARAANEIPEFRWRIRDSKVVEHEKVTPSFTVLTEVTDVFSFCQVEYESNARSFIQRAYTKSEQMKKVPSLSDDKGRDDYLFLSAIPWVSFTSFQHAMNYHPHDSVPRLTWGKFFDDFRGKRMMPLSVQVHHAVVDGRHVGQYFQLVEKMAARPELYFSGDATPVDAGNVTSDASATAPTKGVDDN